MKSSVRISLTSALGLFLIGLLVFLSQNSQLAQSRSKNGPSLEALRAKVEQAVMEEKLYPTKESALALDDAIENYNRLQAKRDGPIDLKLSPGLNINGPTPVVATETEPNNTSGTANSINLTSDPCAIVTGAINPGGDVDFFTFTAPAGSRIWIETDTGGTQNAGANSRDTVIDLLAADGATVIENDDDDGTGNGGDGTIETGLASMIGGRTLTAGGTYFIRVRAFSGTGIINPYRLFVTLTNVAATAEVEANNTAATANSLVTGTGQTGLRSGSINAAGDVDYYSVVATAGNIVYFNVDADPERDGTGTDLVVEFRDPSDVLLLSVDSSITGSVANPAAEGANFTISTPGTYFIKVRHFSGTGTGTYHIMASTCDGSCLTCPANITASNDPNQCGAVVNYPAPTTDGTCSGTITCSPASGSFFPVGTTTVTCQETPSNETCTFTITVNDNQPPSIICPSNQTVVSPNPATPAVVNYPPPTASDNCPGVVVVCNPPSGSSFPPGTTTVTCTATDASGNTATCSFTVSTFDIGLEDDSGRGVLLWNSASGAYRICVPGGTTFTGVGTSTISGNTYALTHYAPDRRLNAKFDNLLKRGSAGFQVFGLTTYTIADRNTTNDTYMCPP